MIVLIPCCGEKLTHDAPARDLYPSPLFKKARDKAEASGCRWFVLSALHGLVDPDQTIAPYDLTLSKMTADQRQGWGWMVFQQLLNLGLTGESFLSLCGDKYTAPLLETGLAIGQPLKGKGIGEQLAFLSRRT